MTIKLIKPMKHQVKSLKFIADHERTFDMSDPGTGKSFVHIKAFEARRRKGAGCTLILAPKSLLKTAWGNDFAKFAPDLKVSIAYAENREKAFAVDADAYITNIDAVNWLAKQNKKFFARFDSIASDEISAYKHHNSQRSRALNTIKKYFKYRHAMSGTPNSNTICDIWNPMSFLDDGERLGGSFFAFRGAVCVPEQVGPRAEMIRWRDKDGAEEMVFGQIADITIRHRVSDCLDIPATHYYTMPYSLPAKQLKAYLEMERTALLKLQDVHITAINAAAVRTKLLQIASGAVYESPDNYHLVDTGRYELVMDLIAERKHPLVFFLWKHQRDQLVAHAERRGMKYCVFDGSATSREREEMEYAYQAGFYDVMFAHPKSAAHGLTLTRGTSIIWASPTDDAEWWAQGNRRQARTGQTEKTEVIAVLAEGTIEDRVYNNMQGKNGRMRNLLDLFAEAA